jgi:riboflavin synthase
MFSGIIKCIGKVEVVRQEGSTLLLTISSALSDSLRIDQSVAHDGVCLTIINVDNGTHQVEVVNETSIKSTLGNVREGQLINLEKSISPTTLLDGHLVQGHVDTTLNCNKIVDLDGSWKFTFDLPHKYASLIIPQGSVCINGVSLTVSDLTGETFSVSIIPYTYENTNFRQLREGDKVNIEFDLIGKYIIRQLELRSLSE